MADVTGTTARVREMLDTSPWEYSVDDDDPNTFTLEFETSVREHLRVSVIVTDEWVVISHIFGRNPTENEAVMHRRLLELEPRPLSEASGKLPGRESRASTGSVRSCGKAPRR